MERLAKASLAHRSSALSAELRNESSVNSVIALLHLHGAGSPARIRTVSMS
jgi:hypothetical protein